MIPYAEALDIIEGAVIPSQSTELVPVHKAAGRVLAEDVLSTVSNPPFRASAMDGFALCSEETSSASEDKSVTLGILSTLAAGDDPVISFQPNGAQAVEIMTGAVVPDMCDAVVRVEDVSVSKSSAEGRTITLTRAVEKGANIREAGEDFLRNEVLISSGSVLMPHHLMLCLSAGVSHVACYVRPRVGILCTGAELVECDEQELVLSPGKIFNSCGPFLSAAAPLYGAKGVYYGVVPDEPKAFSERLQAMLADNLDVVLTTGAVSMGRYDFIPGVLSEMGAETLFHKVAIRPGKPLLCARLKNAGRQVMLFGLPGNPVASVAGMRFFVDFYLRKCLGRPEDKPFSATLAADVKKPEWLTRFCLGNVQVTAAGATFRAHDKQQSFMLSPTVRSSAWAVLPQGKAVVAKGEVVDCHWMYPLSVGTVFCE